MKVQYVMEDSQRIDPVPEGVPRPLWSVMIPVYNRTKFVRQAVESVLAQDPGLERMQVCIVDNSTELIDWSSILSQESLERIELYKQPVSVSVQGNWNTCIGRARGSLVHILHDDDWVGKGFYSEIERMYNQSPKAGMFVTRSFFVSDIGIIEGLTQNDAQSEFISYDINDFFPLTPIQSPAVVVNRCTYEQLGGFRSDMNYVIDLEMWLRVVATRGVRYSPQVLAYYRQSMDNGTHRLIQHGDNLRDLERFCRFAINEYPNLSSIDWENKLRDLALRQELYCTQKGMTDSARIASQFWHEHSSFLQRLKRFLFGFIRR